MTQSTRLFRALPACVVAASLALAAPLAAQQTVRLAHDTPMRAVADAGQDAVATVAAGTEVTLGGTQGSLVQGTFQGYIWAASVGRAPRGSPYGYHVTARNGENLRTEPNGQVVSRLPNDFFFDRVARQGGWVQAKVTGWFDAAAVGTAAAGTPPNGADSAPPRPAGGTGDSGAVDLDRALVARGSDLYRVPDGQVTGHVQADAAVKVVARAGDWVRVQTEGWMKAEDLRPAGGVLVGVSGSEIRSRPQEFEGKLIQWKVQFISIQTADELRHDIPAGRRYVLARGPMPEAGFVYLLAGDAQIREFERLQPLAELVIVGRVRIARSEYLGNPILDLVDMRPVQP